MKNELIILIIVDVIAALASNDLENNIYLIDNNPAEGSGKQGTSKRVPACADGQSISWELIPVDAETNITIASFSGSAVPANINPVMYDEHTWGGAVAGHQKEGPLPYTCTFVMDGKKMSFSTALLLSSN